MTTRATRRKGISFTLTLVVIGVVLLMTALTVIVVGGGEITKFFQRQDEANLDAAIGNACSQLADSIDKNYCDYYVGSDCSDVRANPSNDYQSTAAQEGCNWQDQAGSADAGLDSILEGADNEPIVTVQGNDYNCFDENKMTPTCPAG